MTQGDGGTSGRTRRGRGFSRAGGLVEREIRRAGEARGFSEARLVLRWGDVVGREIAALCRPVKVVWGRGGFGATLTLLTRGGAAPLVQTRLPVIRDRVNSCYGYNAISRIRLTQTAPTGFAEGQSVFEDAHTNAIEPEDEVSPDAAAQASKVQDPDLRAALAVLGTRIRTKPRKRGFPS
ncbi:MAG: DUF721 domain-containing protein [Pseudomonadota bacterium]